MIKKYRKKPVVVEAIQWDGGDFGKIKKWVDESGSSRKISELVYSRALLIETLEGEMRVSEGDWLIKGAAGEFYPCKSDIFEATYDEVKEDKGEFGLYYGGTVLLNTEEAERQIALEEKLFKKREEDELY